MRPISIAPLRPSQPLQAATPPCRRITTSPPTHLPAPKSLSTAAPSTILPINRAAVRFGMCNRLRQIRERSMKAFLIGAAAFLACTGAASADTRNLQGFTGVGAEGQFHVDVSVADHYSVEVTGPDAAKIDTHLE